jgi:uncharacterized protein YecE (DUF72 family)
MPPETEDLSPELKRCLRLVAAAFRETDRSPKRRTDSAKRGRLFLATCVPGGVRQRREVFVYFDNDQKAAAPKDAQRLIRLVKD